MSLIDYLQHIPEFRAARGQRHELWLVLLPIILGAMLGYWGYRPLAEFVEVYGQEICYKLELAPDTKLPSCLVSITKTALLNQISSPFRHKIELKIDGKGSHPNESRV